MTDKNETYLITDRMSLLVEGAYEAIVNLLSDSSTSLEQVRGPVFEVIEETRVALEELRVANEELRQQQEELEASRHTLQQERLYYHSLFNAAPIGYLLTDRDGTIAEANHRAAEMLGVAVDNLSGKPLAVFIPLEHRATFRQNLITIGQTGKIQTWETAYTARDGAAREIELIVAPLEGHYLNGSVKLRWLLHDISHQKQAEAMRLDEFFRETFEQSPVGIGHIGFDGRWMRVNQALCAMLGYSREELIGLKVQELAFADDAVRFNDAHRQIIDGVLPIVGLELRCLSKRGEIVWVRLGISSVSDAQGHHAYSIAIISDITESKRIAAAERKQRLLTEALRDTALTLNSTLNFEEVLDRIMAVIGGIFSQTAATITLEERGAFHVVRAWGYTEIVADELEKAIVSLKSREMPEGIFKRMKDTFKPVIFNNWSDHGAWEQVPEIHAIRSLIAVPIISSDDLIGGLLLYSPLPDTFSASEGELLEIFAAHAAVAIRNARAHQQARLLAAHEERQRLARDLHDSVTQSLFSASIISESLVRRQKAPDESTEQMKELHLLTRGALAEMRTLLMELRPEYLLKSPLSTQIRQLGDALRSRKRMEIEFDFKGDGTLPGEIHIGFYRIAQEIFNNVIKHSQASNLDVHLDSGSDSVLLEVCDDGVGFDPAAVEPGIGMTTMRERADAIRAALTIESKPGSGTRVILQWPT